MGINEYLLLNSFISFPLFIFLLLFLSYFSLTLSFHLPSLSPLITHVSLSLSLIHSPSLVSLTNTLSKSLSFPLFDLKPGKEVRESLILSSILLSIFLSLNLSLFSLIFAVEASWVRRRRRRRRKEEIKRRK